MFLRYYGESNNQGVKAIYLIPAFPLIFSNNREFYIDRVCFFYLLLSTEQVRRWELNKNEPNSMQPQKPIPYVFQNVLYY